MGIYKQIEGPVKAVLNDLMADTDLRKQITYRRYNAQSFSESSGHEVDTFTSTTIYALRLKHTHKSELLGMVAGGGAIQVGDQMYLIRYSDAPSNMSLKDDIVDENGVTQNIKDITDIFGLAVALTIEGGY